MKWFLDLDDYRMASARSTRVLADLPKEMWPMAVLINDMVDTQFDETEITREMSSDARAKNTRNVALALIRSAIKDLPTLLVMEDLHRIDSPSLSLILDICQSIDKNMLVMLSTRPMVSDAAVEYERILALPHTKRIKLSPLDEKSTSTMIGNTLGVSFVPEPVTKRVFEETSGLPLFTEEVALYMVDSGEIEVRNGAITIMKLNPPDQISFNPELRMNQIIISRIDQLGPAIQLAFKVCAVIGQKFSLSILKAVHPQHPPKEEIQVCLNQLVDLRLLEVVNEDDPEDPVYAFKVALHREVAKSMLVMDQKKLIHKDIVS
eukprot:14305_1